ncbi:MAG TPA: WXG100 family type VII secretion target [Anaerolineae bacterium]|nr:WXG100 family type VII secretion target [Anaerolineae bacterium]HMR66787.1 WXG100 family type VII secretion target [Anaerolineae bacterium]
MDQVYMDVPAVRNMAKAFGTISEVLQGVVKVLEMLIMTLKTTAFIGLVGGAAVAQFLEMIKPHIEDLAEKCEEISGDLDKSVDAYERGDALGATRFY